MKNSPRLGLWPIMIKTLDKPVKAQKQRVLYSTRCFLWGLCKGIITQKQKNN